MVNTEFLTIDDLITIGKNKKNHILILIILGALGGAGLYLSSIKYETKFAFDVEKSIKNLDNSEKMNHSFYLYLETIKNNPQYYEYFLQEFKKQSTDVEHYNRFIGLLNNMNKDESSEANFDLSINAMPLNYNLPFSVSMSFQTSNIFVIHYITRESFDPKPIINSLVSMVNMIIKENNDLIIKSTQKEQDELDDIYKEFLDNRHDIYLRKYSTYTDNRFENLLEYYALKRDLNVLNSQNYHKKRFHNYNSTPLENQSFNQTESFKQFPKISKDLENHSELLDKIDELQSKNLIDISKKESLLSQLKEILTKDLKINHNLMRADLTYLEIIDTYNHYLNKHSHPILINSSVPLIKPCNKSKCKMEFKNNATKSFIKFMIGGSGIGLILSLFLIIVTSIIRTSYREHEDNKTPI